jgi:hypothetical protein
LPSDEYENVAALPLVHRADAVHRGDRRIPRRFERDHGVSL